MSFLARFHIAIFLFCGFLSGAFVESAKVCAQTQAPVVNAVQFEGTPLYPDLQLQSYLRTQANRRFFNLPNVTPWLWIYRWGAKSRLPKRIKNAILKSGDPPALLESVAIQTDTTRLRIFYQQQGYRWARICPEIRSPNATRTHIDSVRATVFDLSKGTKSAKCNLPPPSQSPKVNVVFHVYLGNRLFVRAYRYEGLNHLSDADRQACIAPSLLNPDNEANTQNNFPSPPNSPYDEGLLYNERRRLVSCLQNRGFAQISRDSVLAVAYTKSDSLEIALQVQTGRKYKLGNFYFGIDGQEDMPSQRADTLWQEGRFAIVSQMQNESRLNPQYPRELLKIYPNTWFNQSKLLESKNAMDATGLFSFTTFEPRFDRQFQDSTGQWILPIAFSLSTQKRLNFRSNASILQGTGSNTLTGLQTGLSVANTNTRGKGEQLRTSLRGAIAFDVREFFKSNSTRDLRFPHRQIETEVIWAFPYLKKALFRAANLAKMPTENMRTELVFNLLFARQPNYYSLIRPKVGFRYGLDIAHSATQSSHIDLADFYINNVQLTDTLAFRTDVLNQILDPKLRQQTYEEFSSARINNAFRYIYRQRTANPLKRDRGLSREISAEFGGTIFNLIDRLILQPDEIDDKLGKTFIYSQYLRFSADFRRYRARGSKDVYASKFFIGWAYPLRDSLNLPFDRRFFIGGNTSLRGWDEDSLGVVALGASKAPLGAPIKHEMSFEWRRTVLQRFFAASWIVVPFIDAGATWYGRHTPRDVSTQSALFRFDRFYKQYSISHGLGLRIAWDYLILGFDWAWRLRERNLAQENATSPPEGLWQWHYPFSTRSRFHLLIGHTF